MIEPIFLVGTGGAIGAVLRHYIGVWLQDVRVPIATLSVNVFGSFVLGLITFAHVTDHLLLFVGIGACGSFTTYSTFSLETIQLWENGEWLRATIYAGGTLLAAGLAAGVGAGVVLLV